MIIQIPEHSHPMECPQCGKRAIVQEGSSIYTCLNCSFRRDVSEPVAGQLPTWLLLVTGIFVVLILL